LVDFLIVVLGIFTGLQVQDWSVERTELRQEKQYLQRILDDVNRSLSVNQLILNNNRNHNDSTWSVFQNLSNCQVNEDQRAAFANGLFNVGKLTPSAYAMETLDEMQSSGNYHLIKNDDVRRVLNKLLAHFENEKTLFPLIASRVSPSLAYIDQRTIVNKRGLYSQSSIEWEDLRIDFDKMCTDPLVLGALTMVRQVSEIYVSRNERAIASLEAAKVVVLSELGTLD
jgi:hypothetical protein